MWRREDHKQGEGDGLSRYDADMQPVDSTMRTEPGYQREQKHSQDVIGDGCCKNDFGVSSLDYAEVCQYASGDSDTGGDHGSADEHRLGRAGTSQAHVHKAERERHDDA